MEALLIYNPNAGGGAEDQARELQDELRELGYEPVYRATRREEELDIILPEANGLVVVVGGDGTLRAVVTRLTERDLPIALIPNGTANNVGRTLGIEGDPVDVIRRLKGGTSMRIDVGRVRYPWGVSYFLEGAGFGLYAEALARYRPEDGKSLLRGAGTLAELMSEIPRRATRMRLDGQTVEGEFLLVDAMNMGAIGPRIPLAPESEPGDGLLDLVQVRADACESFLHYLDALLNEQLENLDSVEIQRVKKLEFLWTGFPVHQDAGYVDPEGRGWDLSPTWVEIDLLPGHLEFLLPGATGATQLKVPLSSAGRTDDPAA